MELNYIIRKNIEWCQKDVTIEAKCQKYEHSKELSDIIYGSKILITSIANF